MSTGRRKTLKDNPKGTANATEAKNLLLKFLFIETNLKQAVNYHINELPALVSVCSA